MRWLKYFYCLRGGNIVKGKNGFRKAMKHSVAEKHWLKHYLNFTCCLHTLYAAAVLCNWELTGFYTKFDFFNLLVFTQLPEHLLFICSESLYIQ